MTFAWYWHIKPSATPLPLWQIVLISWGIAFFEYCLAVPANNLRAQRQIKPFQLKILQEVIALVVFSVFAVVYLNEGFKLSAEFYLHFRGGLFRFSKVNLNRQKGESNSRLYML